MPLHRLNQTVERSHLISSRPRNQPLPRRFEPLGFAHMKDLIQEIKPGRDLARQFRHPLLLVRLVGSQLPEPKHQFPNPGDGGLAPQQVGFVANDDVAALIRFGLVHQGKNFLEGRHRLVGLRHPPRRFDVLERGLVCESADKDQNRERKTESCEHLAFNRPLFHSAFMRLVERVGYNYSPINLAIYRLFRAFTCVSMQIPGLYIVLLFVPVCINP